MTRARNMPPAIEEEWPAVCLVRPQMGENIGAVARVLLNFGLISLRLVSPRDRWPNPKAIAVAVGADSVLEAARIEWKLEDAIADATLGACRDRPPARHGKAGVGPARGGGEAARRHRRGRAAGRDVWAGGGGAGERRGRARRRDPDAASQPGVRVAQSCKRSGGICVRVRRSPPGARFAVMVSRRRKPAGEPRRARSAVSASRGRA